jgi:hypothetical protein
MRNRTLQALAIVAAITPAWAVAAECRATAPAKPPLVVELYTSEGCSSCPPADRWLSTLKGRDDIVALGFHVNYWDRLGWPDRLASREITERQYERNRVLGRPNVYTPQVLADGRDWTGWPRLPEPAPRAAIVASLAREGDRVRLAVAATPAGAPRLAGYWAVLEDGHVSRVRAGENAGTTLRHDHVVRRYVPLLPWDARQPLAATLDLDAPVAAHPRRIVVVITTPDGRPVQSVTLAC